MINKYVSRSRISQSLLRSLAAGSCDSDLYILHCSIGCSDVWDSLWVCLREDELQHETVLVAGLFEVLSSQNCVEVLHCWNAMAWLDVLCFFGGLMGAGWFWGLCVGGWLVLLGWFVLLGWLVLLSWFVFLVLHWLWCWLFNMLGCVLGVLMLFDVFMLLDRVRLFHVFFFPWWLLGLSGLRFRLLLNDSLLLFVLGLFGFGLGGWSFNLFFVLLFLDWWWFYFFSSLNNFLFFLWLFDFGIFDFFNKLLFWFLFSDWLFVCFIVGILLVVSWSSIGWSIVLLSLIIREVLPSFRKDFLVIQILLSSANDYVNGVNVRAESSKKLYLALLTVVLTCLPTLIHFSSFFLCSYPSWSPFILLAIIWSSLRKIFSTE